MKIAVCDDMPSDCETLEKLLDEYQKKTGSQLKISVFNSGESLLDALKKTSFNIIFLDIYMNALNGIKTATKIRKFDKNVQIIFATSSPDFAVSSYDVRALYYIIKPMTYCKLEKVLNLCQMEDAKENCQIEILTGKSFSTVKLCDIIYAEMFNKVLSIHTTYGTLESRTTMENFELLLGGVPFLRCHRSLIVSMDFVAGIKDDNFLLSSGDLIHISRPAKALCVKTYNQYIFSGMRQTLC